MLRGLGVEVDVCSDNDLILDDVGRYEKIILSPGPGLPAETNSMMPLLATYAESKTILGICLGMQGIALHFKGQLKNMQHVDHGVSRKVSILRQSKLFKGLDADFTAGVYHSWNAEVHGVESIKETAVSELGITMAIEHISLPIYGLQFHPESIMTENGKEIIRNFIEL
jgi:anthranilate synthase component 2